MSSKIESPLSNLFNLSSLSKSFVSQCIRLISMLTIVSFMVLVATISYASDNDTNSTQKRDLDLHFGAYVMGGVVESGDDFKKFDNRSKKESSLAFSAELGSHFNMTDNFRLTPYIDFTALGEYKNSVTVQIGLGVMSKYKIDDNYSIVGSLEAHKAVLSVLSDYNAEQNNTNSASSNSKKEKNKNNVNVRYRGTGAMVGLGVEYQQFVVKLIYNTNHYSKVYKIEYNTNDITDSAKREIRNKAPNSLNANFIGIAVGVVF